MKIGCPNCGQHYDVEAGAIDRYFRCPECGELFRGINAKSVKARRYRRKSKSGTAGAPGTPVPAAPGAVPPPAPPSPGAEAHAEVAPQAEPETPTASPPEKEGDLGAPPRRFPEMTPLRWALCAAGLLLALFTVVLLVQNRRINALAARHADYAAALLRQGQGAAVFAQDTAEALEAVKNLELRLTEAENSIRRVAALAGDAGLAARVSQLELKLDADDAAANAPGTLNSRLESCQAKIAQLEKSLTDAAAAQNAARRQLAADWLRIMGSPRPGDTRTALDRIALLEQLMMNNLNAAERPDRLPRRPVTVRLETLETLLAGSEDILAAQSHPGGVLLQLETLKQEVAKLKWALGK